MKFTIYGNPVEHSKSPQMHNAGFKKINFDGDYTKTHLEDGKTLKQHFLDNDIQGANITVPHKEEAFKQADEVIGLAKEIGAVNTYTKCKNGEVKAYNTDASGFMMAIEEYGNIQKALILGAGGTAKAIAVAFKGTNIDTTVLNRSENRLEFFEKLGCKTSSWDNFNCEKYDLVINSTSAGLKDNNYPTPRNILDNILDNSTNAVDCIYGKMTPFLTMACEKGLKYKDGEDMLLYQGVLAFELFTSTKADNKVVEAMREGLRNS
jgi:shikimate dehydrogenase